jgi:hypothetical protein
VKYIIPNDPADGHAENATTNGCFGGFAHDAPGFAAQPTMWRVIERNARDDPRH